MKLKNILFCNNKNIRKIYFILFTYRQRQDNFSYQPILSTISYQSCNSLFLYHYRYHRIVETRKFDDIST